jgi:hypothetical protein
MGQPHLINKNADIAGTFFSLSEIYVSSGEGKPIFTAIGQNCDAYDLRICQVRS